MDKPLRGDFALTILIVAAPVVGDVQAVSLQQCTGYGLKTFQRNIASAHAQDMHPTGNFLAAKIFSTLSLTLSRKR
jgi:hypothetical protein